MLPLFCFLLSCETAGNQGEIDALEKKVEADPNLKNINELVGKYEEYIKTNPDDVEMNGRYLYRAASKRYQAKNMQAVTRYLQRGITEFAGSSVTPNSLLLLSNTYKDQFKNAELADFYAAALKQAYPNHENAAKVESKNTMDDLIAANRNSMFTDSTNTRLNPAVARKLVGMYGTYASVLPKDAKTPEYLYSVYEIANSSRLFADAAKACEKLYKNYPDYEKSSTAMFLTGYLYENELRDLDKAKGIYTEFLSKYPKHDFADDAEFALANLGKSPDQILKELQEKNKANSGGE